MPTDLIENNDSQLGKMVGLLESAGYKRTEVMEAMEIGQFEYALYSRAGKKMLILGAGRGGDDGAYVNFYFTIDSEELVEHAAGFED